LYGARVLIDEPKSGLMQPTSQHTSDPSSFTLILDERRALGLLVVGEVRGAVDDEFVARLDRRPLLLRGLVRA
jgi:hypothetical protein